VVFFYVRIGDSPRFHRGAALCNTNPCGLTLRSASKLAFSAITEAFWSLPTNPLISTKKISHECVVFFLCKIRDSPRFHRGVALRNTNPCGLTLRSASKLAFSAITEAFWSLPTNPLISTKKISHECVVFFYVRIRDFPTISSWCCFMQHEPLRADRKQRETQARSICGNRA